VEKPDVRFGFRSAISGRCAPEPRHRGRGVRLRGRGAAVPFREPRRDHRTQDRHRGLRHLNDLNLHEEYEATLPTLIVTYPDAEIRDMILATGMIGSMETSYARLEWGLLA